jgi:hypothetical protein
MKQIVPAFLTVLVTSAITAQAPDCTISESVLVPYTHGNTATKLQWRQSGDAFENLYVRCPAGPAGRASRAVFFQLVDLVFKAGETVNRGERDPDRSEAIWESANQYEYDFRQYMDRIVNENDIEFKAVILKTANAGAISRLGPDAKYDVLRMVHIADPARIGAGHHSAYGQAILTLGLWIDPADERFTADEKREMTDLLMAKASEHPEAVNAVDIELESAGAVLRALGHASTPEAISVLQKWTQSPNPSLQEAAQEGTAAVRARMKKGEQ